jgi:hypothetical protein
MPSHTIPFFLIVAVAVSLLAAVAMVLNACWQLWNENRRATARVSIDQEFPALRGSVPLGSQLPRTRSA